MKSTRIRRAHETLTTGAEENLLKLAHLMGVPAVFVTEHLVACTRAGVQAGFHAQGDDVEVEGQAFQQFFDGVEVRTAAKLELCIVLLGVEKGQIIRCHQFHDFTDLFQIVGPGGGGRGR